MNDQLGKYALLRRQMMLEAIMPYIIVAIILLIAAYVVTAVGLWKLFEKSGEKGWKAIIPFYNSYVLFKLTWNIKWFWVSLFGSLFITLFGNLKVGSTWATVFLILIILVSIGLFVLSCFAMYKVTQAYGKKPVFTVGLVLLPYVFFMILGFGEAEYRPVASTKKDEAKSFKLPTLKKVSAKKKPAAKPAAKSAPKKASKDKIDYVEPKPKAKF